MTIQSTVIKSSACGMSAMAVSSLVEYVDPDNHRPTTNSFFLKRIHFGIFPVVTMSILMSV